MEVHPTIFSETIFVQMFVKVITWCSLCQHRWFRINHAPVVKPPSRSFSNSFLRHLTDCELRSANQSTILNIYDHCYFVECAHVPRCTENPAVVSTPGKMESPQNRSKGGKVVGGCFSGWTGRSPGQFTRADPRDLRTIAPCTAGDFLSPPITIPMVSAYVM